VISGVRGRIARKLPGIVLVDLHGLTLRVLTSQTTTADIGDVGDEVDLVTHLYVREDQLTLFGFATPEELQLFELLLTVNSVGPKAALSMLSSARPADLHHAIASEDIATLSRVPGIGKKTAQRIILDLRGKLPEPAVSVGASFSVPDVEALEALQALGYSATEARDALARLEHHEGQTIEERVYAALQSLARS
jgi:Holliday junction DNA helicase RuvA